MVLRYSLIICATVLASTPALADAPCFGSFTKGQERLKANKLVEARAEFAVCVGDTTCPAPPLLNDCQAALEGVNARIGSIVVSTPQPTMNVVIAIDGIVVARSLDGRAIELDPGMHHIELTPADRPAVVRDVLLTEGEKLKRVSFDVVEPKPISVRSSPPPYAAWTFGAVGLVAVGAFAVIAGTGQSTYDGCQNQPCSNGTLDSLRIERVIAWTTLGVGVAALVTSTVLFLTHRSGEKKTAWVPWVVRF